MILVTGGAGFIGSVLVAALEKKGESVAVCDWFGHDDKWRNLAKRKIEAIIAPEKLADFLKERGGDIEAVFHMGAISATTETDVDLIVESNFRLSQFLWKWCAETNKRFIYASSAATYGDGSAGFKDDESDSYLSNLHPLNAYGWSKLIFDKWVQTRKQNGDKAPAQCVGLKFFNVFGPNEYHKEGQRSVAVQVFPFAARHEPFALFKSHNPAYQDGGQLRDFIWVGDVVNVMTWLLDHPKVNGLFNVGTGKARSFVDLANAVYLALGQSPLIRYRDMPVEIRGKYQYYTQADMTKLLAAGYTQPFTSLEDGIKSYVQDYLVHTDPYI